MIISYSTWTDLRDCPKRFEQLHILKQVPTVPVNEYHALYGTLVQKFFEYYCNTWRFKTPYLFPDIIQERLGPILDALLVTRTVNWNSGPGKDEIIKKAAEDISTIMEGHGLNWFLNTRAELGLSVKLSCGHSISGRLDFVHTNAMHGGVYLFDGKGTSKKKNVDPDQLYWYSLLYWLHHKVMPSGIGFFFWKLNEYEEHPLSLDLLNAFRARISLMVKSIDGVRSYAATPSAKACRYCQFANSCPEGLLDKGSRAKKSKVDIQASGDGVLSFGF